MSFYRFPYGFHLYPHHQNLVLLHLQRNERIFTFFLQDQLFCQHDVLFYGFLMNFEKIKLIYFLWILDFVGLISLIFYHFKFKFTQNFHLLIPLLREYFLHHPKLDFHFSSHLRFRILNLLHHRYLSKKLPCHQLPQQLFFISYVLNF